MRNLFVVLAFALLVSCANSPPPPSKPLAAPVLESPAPVPKPAPKSGYEVSPEKKQASLVAIRGLVDRLNAIIAKKSFEEWKTYLDEAYIATYGDPVRLKDISANSPFLKQYNVKLKSLEDYFRIVVVPSRAAVSVDDITFLDENRVDVWAVVDNERVLLYLLKLYGKEWKISSW